MATYSAFFSSGLRTTPPPPSSPVVPDIFMEDLGHDMRSHTHTPTPSSASSSMVNVVQDSTNVAHRPTLRKRRSSLTLGSTAMSSIKSPARSAGNALQRHYSTMSVTGSTMAGGTRSRSGSNAALKGQGINAGGESVLTRSRSGSVGTALRPRGKMVRRAALPPPSAPLPPLPPLPPMPTTAPANKLAFNSHLNVEMTPSTPERARSRAYSIENGYHICEESP